MTSVISKKEKIKFINKKILIAGPKTDLTFSTDRMEGNGAKAFFLAFVGLHEVW